VRSVAIRASFSWISLELAERASELPAPGGVRHRLLQRPRRHAARGRRDRGPEPVERGQPSLNPSPSAPRRSDAGTRQSSNAISPSGCGAESTRGRTNLKPGRVGCDHERRRSPCCPSPVAGGEDGVKVRNPGVRDEGLHADENVAVAVPCRGRRNRGHVRAASGSVIANDAIARPARTAGSQRSLSSRAPASRIGTVPRAWSANTASASGRGARQGLAHEARRAQVLVCDRREPVRLAEPCQEIARLGPRGGVVGGLGRGAISPPRSPRPAPPGRRGTQPGRRERWSDRARSDEPGLALRLEGLVGCAEVGAPHHPAWACASAFERGDEIHVRFAVERVLRNPERDRRSAATRSAKPRASPITLALRHHPVVQADAERRLGIDEIAVMSSSVA